MDSELPLKLIVYCSSHRDASTSDRAVRFEFDRRACEAVAQREGKPIEEVSLLDLLLNRGIEIDSSCGGMGTCGTCRIQFELGQTPPPLSELEIELRSQRNESSGDLFEARQSCQLYVERVLNGTVWRIQS